MITSKQFCHDFLKDIVACKDPLDRVKIADGYAKILDSMLEQQGGEAVLKLITDSLEGKLKGVQQEPATL